LTASLNAELATGGAGSGVVLIGENTSSTGVLKYLVDAHCETCRDLTAARRGSAVKAMLKNVVKEDVVPVMNWCSAISTT
jgi:hypothetical protein